MENLEIRKEVLDYFRKIGEDLKKDLSEEELAFAKCMEDPILSDKVREVERNGSEAITYYQEMKQYYDKYVSLDNRRLPLEKRLIDFAKDFKKLIGGYGVNFAIKVKKRK